MAHRPAQPNPEARLQTQTEVEAYVNEMREMAETPAELRIVTLTSRWTNWSQRWGSRPTAANERREELAWRQLRIALVAMDAEEPVDGRYSSIDFSVPASLCSTGDLSRGGTCFSPLSSRPSS